MDEIKKIAVGLVIAGGAALVGTVVGHEARVSIVETKIDGVAADVKEIKCAVTKLGCK